MLDGIRQSYGKATMEAIGTFILLLTIQLAVAAPNGGTTAPAAIGVALMAAVYAGGPISGAHYNPAISLAIMLRGKQEVKEMLVYWLFQLIGGTLGALVGGFVAGNYAVGEVGDESTPAQAAVAEICYAFCLCFVVLGVATHSKAEGNSYYGAAIGLTVTAGAVAVGSVSGGAFNPAVALGLSIAKGFDNLGYCIVTAICDLIGGAIAAGCFYMVAQDQYGGASGEYESVGAAAV